MSRSRTIGRGAILLAAATGFCTVAAHANPITHFTYSSSFVQAESTGFSTGPDYMQKQLVSNGGFVSTGRSLDAPEGTAAAGSSANLASGELKALAETTASGDGGYFSAFARADFGDSFRTYAGNSPFTWASDTEASFSFDLTGLVDLNGADNGSQFGLTILAPGALDAYARWLGGENTFAEWNSQVITSFFYGLGPGVVAQSWMTGVVTDYPDSVSASFTPGSDFDWVLTLISNVGINGSFTVVDAYGLTDFSNTLHLAYSGPDNTTTYSGSGLFPSTLALAAAPTAIPEPASALLFLAGLGALRHSASVRVVRPSSAALSSPSSRHRRR
jgi:hypothetical protein